MFVLISLVVLAGLAMILMYNGLVAKTNTVDNVSATVDALLRKRYDLIPNLVAAVQGYMGHERALLTELTTLRGRALSGGSITNQPAADREIAKAIGRVMAVAEGYPDLKASENFLNLQASLNEIEEQISASRRAYNAAVTQLNNALEMIPGRFMGRIMGLQPRQLFEATQQERQAVDVGELMDR